MRKYIIIFLLCVAACSSAFAADEFDDVKCGSDISKALIGKHSPNERVVILEKRHSDIGLKDLGAIEISARLSLVSWRICGNEYAELINTKSQIVRDILLIPSHSLSLPESFVEGCRVGDKKISEAVIAILDNSQGRKPSGYLDQVDLPARTAWKIDERQEKFVSISTQSLSCAVSGSSEDMK